MPTKRDTDERDRHAMHSNATKPRVTNGPIRRPWYSGLCGGNWSRKKMLAFGIVLGAAIGTAIGIGGGVAVGIGSFGGVVAYTVLVVALSGRFEPMAVLSATRTDERRRQIDLKATAAVGRLLVIVLIVGAGWEVAHGSHGPMVWMCMIGGFGYLAAVAYYSRRG